MPNKGKAKSGFVPFGKKGAGGKADAKGKPMPPWLTKKKK